MLSGPNGDEQLAEHVGGLVGAAHHVPPRRAELGVDVAARRRCRRRARDAISRSTPGAVRRRPGPRRCRPSKPEWYTQNAMSGLAAAAGPTSTGDANGSPPPRPLCTATIGPPVARTACEERPRRPAVPTDRGRRGTSPCARACTPSTPRSRAGGDPPSPSSAASSGPTFGHAWPWISTRPSPHSSAAIAPAALHHLDRQRVGRRRRRGSPRARRPPCRCRRARGRARRRWRSIDRVVLAALRLREARRRSRRRTRGSGSARRRRCRLGARRRRASAVVVDRRLGLEPWTVLVGLGRSVAADAGSVKRP